MSPLNTTPTLENLETFLARLARQEVKLWLDGERLRCSGPEEVLTDALNAQLKERKSEIIAFLQQTQGVQENAQKTPTIEPAERPDNIPLSFAQQRLWFLHQMQPDSAVYNLPLAIKVNGLLDIDALNQSLNQIIARHEILRTRFVTVSGQPVQQIEESISFEIEQINIQTHPDKENAVKQAAIDAAKTSFDLSKDQLLRVTLLKLNDSNSIILFTVHHVIADAWSQEILIQELATFYRAALMGKSELLTPLPVQYADFAIWQQNWLQGDTLTAQLDYWREQLDVNQSVLQLPTDYPRARVQTYQGKVEQFSLSKELSDQLRAIGQQQSATLFMTLMTAFKVLLYRYTGQTDVVVGTPVANRHRAEVEGLIGLFVNTLVLRSQIAPKANFTALLEQIKSTTWICRLKN